MTTTLDITKLKSVLPLLRNAVDDRPIVPIFECIHFCNGSIIATNLRIAIAVVFEVEGDFLLPYRELLRISNLVDEDITVTIDRRSVILQSGEDIFKLGIPNDVKNFPVLPAVEPQLSVPVFAEFFKHVAAAEKCTVIGNDSERILNNVYIQCKAGELSVWGMDRSVLYSYRTDVDADTDANALLNNALTKALSNMGDATIDFCEKFIVVRSETITVYVQKSDQVYQQVGLLNKQLTSDHNYCVAKARFLQELDKALVYDTLQPFITLSFDGKELTFLFDDPLISKSYTGKLSNCHHTGESIRVNGRYLRKIINLIPEDALRITFRNQNETILINNSCLIAPVVQEVVKS